MSKILNQLLLTGQIPHRAYVIANTLLQSGGLQGESWVEDWLVNNYNIKIKKEYNL